MLRFTVFLLILVLHHCHQTYAEVENFRSMNKEKETRDFRKNIAFGTENVVPTRWAK